MKLLVSLLFCLSLFAQESVTIVAVGDAEKDKDKIVFENIKNAGPKSAQLNQILSIIKKDFLFYKHLFDVQASKSSDTLYSVSFTYSGKDLDISVRSIKENKTILSNSFQVLFNNQRSFAHDVANQIYKSIKGVDSIFRTKILYASDRTGNRTNQKKELYIMDFDGSRSQRVTYENAMIISPVISQDNRTVLFTSIESKWEKGSNSKVRKIKNPNLYSYNLITRKKTMLSDKKGINSGAVFAEDGKNIYLTLSNGSNSDIYEMNLKTKATRRITTNFSDDVDPHVNKDGSLMTFLSGRSGKAMIYTMDPRGREKNVKRISYVGRFNSAPRFSPDGKQIVFSSWVDNRFDIYKIDSNGQNLTRLTKNFGSNEEPWFSPDGQFIVFTSQRVLSRTKATQDVYIMNIEGEIVSKITNNYGKCFTPRWSN